MYVPPFNPVPPAPSVTTTARDLETAFAQQLAALVAAGHCVPGSAVALRAADPDRFAIEIGVASPHGVQWVPVGPSGPGPWVGMDGFPLP